MSETFEEIMTHALLAERETWPHVQLLGACGHGAVVPDHGAPWVATVHGVFSLYYDPAGLDPEDGPARSREEIQSSAAAFSAAYPGSDWHVHVYERWSFDGRTLELVDGVWTPSEREDVPGMVAYLESETSALCLRWLDCALHTVALLAAVGGG